MKEGRDFLFGETVDHLPDVFAANARNRDELTGLLVQDANRPRLVSDVRYDPDRPRFRRQVWVLVNTTAAELVDLGAAWTRRAAIRRKHRAYRKALAALSEREQGATS